MNLTPLRAATAAALALALFAGSACSKSEDTSSTTETTEATATTDGGEAAAQTKIFDEMIQGQLIVVGCLKGQADGIMGPKTDAAIVAFQTASKIRVDGELGPQTDAALSKAAESKTIVCVASTTPTTASSTTTAAPYGPNDAPCTATAIAKGLSDPQATITRFGCQNDVPSNDPGSSGRWAGAQYVDADTGGAILLATSGTWVEQDTDALCSAASPQVPALVKQIGCVTKPGEMN